MDEWLIVLGFLLMFFWKQETDRDETEYNQVKAEILSIVESEYQDQVDLLEEELKKIKDKLCVAEDLQKLKKTNLANVEQELDSVRNFIESTNNKSDTLKQDIQEFKDRFGVLFMEVNHENIINEETLLHLQEEKMELLRRFSEVDKQLNSRMNDYKTLKLKYDDAIFRTLESKAKRLRIREELTTEQEYNEALNKSIKDLSNNNELLQNEYLPYFKALESNFVINWEQYKNKYLKEVRGLSKNLMNDLLKYERLDLSRFRHPKHVKSLIDKLDLYAKNTIPEVNKRLQKFGVLISEIDKDYAEIHQKMYAILKSELKLPDDVLPPNMGGESLIKFLDNDLYKDLNIRHVQSIILDQGGSIIDPSDRIGNQESMSQDENEKFTTIRFSYPPKSSSDDELDSSLTSDDTNISSISSGDQALMIGTQLQESVPKQLSDEIITDSTNSDELSCKDIIIKDDFQEDTVLDSYKTASLSSDSDVETKKFTFRTIYDDIMESPVSNSNNKAS